MSDEAQSTKAVEIVNSLPPVQADHEAQFNKAAEIVNSFPKDGPVQADYNTKLDASIVFYQRAISSLITLYPDVQVLQARYAQN